MMLGPDKGYTDLLNEATFAKAKADLEAGKRFQKTPIRPSASGECARALFHQLMEFSGRAKYEVEPNRPELTRLFKLGHSIESHLIREFESHLGDRFEVRYKQQVLSFAFLEAKNDPKLSQWFEGSLDWVLWSPETRGVLDAKSKKDKFSAAYQTGWDELSAKLGFMKSVEQKSETLFWVDDLEAFLAELHDPFFEPNFYQLNMYACSDFLRERGIDHASIIQYSKNDSRIREVRFRPSLKLYQRVIAKMQGVITAVDTGNPELAPKEHMLGSLKCRFCPYSAHCWEGKDAKKAWIKTLPPKQWPKDTDRLGKAGQDIEKLFELYSAQDAAERDKKFTEQAILMLMEQKNVSKIRLEDGAVYEAKKLKDSVVLRRGKA
jgi:hypothetical protein